MHTDLGNCDQCFPSQVLVYNDFSTKEDTTNAEENSLDENINEENWDVNIPNRI